jgi:hypothetical protein
LFWVGLLRHWNGGLGVPLIRARYVFGGEIDTLYQIGVSSARDRRSDVQSHILLCGESNNLGEMSAVEEEEGDDDDDDQREIDIDSSPERILERKGVLLF